MTNPNLAELAQQFHRNLPDRIRQYLHSRGIPDAQVEHELLGWNGLRITIPVRNRAGEIVSFRLARDPDDQTESPKMLSTPGATAELYGREILFAGPPRVVICEGEFDRLVLEAHGFPAVTSTGGAKTFRREWASELEGIPEVYVCFDVDQAGREGAQMVGELIPHAHIVELPEEVGEGGDVSDFFVRLGHTPEDFERLLAEAKPAPLPGPVPLETLIRRRREGLESPTRAEIDRLKREVPIADLIERYVRLRPESSQLMGLCPFHEDRNPSLAVYPKTNRFYCFGCGKHGDQITFLREKENLAFREALDALEKLAAASPHHGPAPEPRTTERKEQRAA
jgi:DNA primase